jgi:K+-transporting ATPase ATPase C chain
MTLRHNALTAVLAMLVLTLLLGIAFPLLITGIGQLAFPGNANGQLVRVDGRLVGSKIIGQQFANVLHTKDGKVKLDSAGNPVTTPDPKYFQTRPSATTPADNAAATTFSNLGPNNKATEREIASNLKAYLALNRPYDPGLTAARVPADAAQSSASGIDPDISVANAEIQAHRIAAVRHVSLSRVEALVHTFTTSRQLGIFGEPSVDVLDLNLALNQGAAR